MHFTIQKEELVSRLSFVSGVVGNHKTIAILSHVLLIAGPDSLSLTGSDLEVEMIAQFPATVTQGGTMAIPGRKFLDIAKALPAKSEVTVKAEDNKIKIKAGKSRFTINVLAAEDFPNMGDIEWGHTFNIDSAALENILSKTQFSMAQQDVRYYLNGIMMEIMTGSIKAVAADGHRLSLCETAADITKDAYQIIIPRKGVTEIMRFVSGISGDITIKTDGRHIRLEANGMSLTSKLIDGRFPDYNRVIPSSVAHAVNIPKSDILDLLRRVSVLTSDKLRSVRMSILDGAITVSARNADNDEATEELKIDGATSGYESGFNVSYLIDAIESVDTDQIVFGWNNGESSTTIRPADNTKAVCVVMPVRL